jgi:hypothetical protein
MLLSLFLLNSDNLLRKKIISHSRILLLVHVLADFQNVKNFARADFSGQIFAQNFDEPISQQKHNIFKFITLRRHKRAF